MAKNVIQGPVRARPLVTPGAVSVGDVFEGNGAIGVWEEDYAAGVLGALIVKGDVELDKNTSEAFAVGDQLYWNTSNNNLTTTVGSNIPVGICVRANLAADTKGVVHLNWG